jgi:hypothetical protein
MNDSSNVCTHVVERGNEMGATKALSPADVKSEIKKLECGDDQASSTPNKRGSKASAGGKETSFKKGK